MLWTLQWLQLHAETGEKEAGRQPGFSYRTESRSLMGFSSGSLGEKLCQTVSLGRGRQRQSSSASSHDSHWSGRSNCPLGSG